MAEIERHAWQWAAAEREFKCAIETTPNYACARSGYAMYLAMQGRAEQVVAESQRARELDPLSLHVTAAANTAVAGNFCSR